MARVSVSAHEALSRMTAAVPLVERARRPAPLASAPDPGAAGPAASPSAGPVTVTPQPPGPAPADLPPLAVPQPPATPESLAIPPPQAVPQPPATPESLAVSRAVPAQPPVTIGEIHVHVAEPAPASADPLALLAPYARGLTARPDGAR